MTTRNKRAGTALERRVVETATKAGVKAVKQPLSGILPDFPSDVVLDNLLVECKMRAAWLSAGGARMLTLDLDWLRGVQANAKRAGFAAGIVVARAKGSPRLTVLLDYDDFLELLRQRNP